MEKTQVCSCRAFCRKAETKAERVKEISILCPEASTKSYFHGFHLKDGYIFGWYQNTLVQYMYIPCSVRNCIRIRKEFTNVVVRVHNISAIKGTVA
jgi:hypothetical protein